ncbi:hypothetical protein IVB45_17340 [Bradyrhizobium sp. 4]|uniref:hypothetical protein n=1 Tax=unclassified Bradyrhizobium TaxID=2631580 RepID=UPI001FF6FCC5|nr:MULTISPECIES: hypothetical protein [unclassified Bradyrhizobium]MCK1402061.1 hypothetical protein [Bradyrhizobium sp. 39]MCK1751219.1 hypothetical protein [Bradyrhizobium sp. 135]UPJ38475.1 hypothetical protein IVB45_17340 [Bradyrhizobium sp. 4]
MELTGSRQIAGRPTQPPDKGNYVQENFEMQSEFQENPDIQTRLIQEVNCATLL